MGWGLPVSPRPGGGLRTAGVGGEGAGPPDVGPSARLGEHRVRGQAFFRMGGGGEY